jgi:hypothetical protein
MHAPSDGPTKDELYEKAQDLDIEGRSEMTKDELADAIEAAEGSSDAPEATASAPGPLRPAQEATNPKVAGPPPVADQPGLGRAANPTPAPGPTPNLGVDRIGSEIQRRREIAASHREAAAQG